jgi:hypothetical protein
MDGETLREHSAQFEAAIAGDLRGYCLQKAGTEEGNEAQTWGFIQARAHSACVPLLVNVERGLYCEDTVVS